MTADHEPEAHRWKDEPSMQFQSPSAEQAPVRAPADGVLPVELPPGEVPVEGVAGVAPVDGEADPAVAAGTAAEEVDEAGGSTGVAGDEAAGAGVEDVATGTGAEDDEAGADEAAGGAAAELEDEPPVGGFSLKTPPVVGRPEPVQDLSVN